MTAFGLRSSRVIVGGAERSATIVIDGETIAAVTDGPVSVPVEDLGDLVLMSGLVDCHVHINEPDVPSGRALRAPRARRGGRNHGVIDMPLNCTPVTTTAEALQVPHLGRRRLLGWRRARLTSPSRRPDASGYPRRQVLLDPLGIDDFPEVGRDELRESFGAGRARSGGDATTDDIDTRQLGRTQRSR